MKEPTLKKAKKKRRKGRFSTMLLAVGFAVTSAILLYPTFADRFNDYHSTSVIKGYEDGVSGMSAKELEEAMEAARAYNEGIAKTQETHPFTYQGADKTDPEYAGLLDFTDGIMCYVDIPTAGIYLPVGHGTSASILEYEAGHMHGTSLPCGGESTHSVIAAHTGLKNAKLFTSLTDVEEGDQFYIHIANEIHAYKVDRVLVVLPEDEDPYLQVVKGKDYITLYTCTPYGVNDHRLLVRGVRTYPDPKGETSESESLEARGRNLMAILGMAGCVAVPVGILLFGIIRTLRDRKKRKKAKVPPDTGGK